MIHTTNLHRGSQRGLSMVEVSVAMVIMGVAAAMSWNAIQGNVLDTVDVENQERIRRAEASVLTFVALSGRLPCDAGRAPSPYEQILPPDPDAPKPVPPSRCWQDGVRLEDRFLPWGALRLPGDQLQRVRYSPFDPASLPQRVFPAQQFRVLLNDLAIQPQGSAPRAQLTALKDVTTSPRYDGVLDFCEVLGQLGRAGVSAFTLGVEKANAEDLLVHSVSAGKVSEALSCPSLVAASRSQFNAHLATAALNRSLKEYKWIFESDYGAYGLDVAEGAFWMSSKLWGELMRWPQTMQALSKFLGDRFVDPTGIRLMVSSLATKVATTMAVIAQSANLARYMTNLEAADARYRVILDLTERGEGVYLNVYSNAVRASSSAYFIREQTPAWLPPVPRPKGDLVPQTVNPLAAEMLAFARDRALDLGATNVASSIKPLPNLSDVRPGISRNFQPDTEDLSAYGVGAAAPNFDALLSEQANAASADAAVSAVDLNMSVDPDADTPSEEEVRADKDGKGKRLQDGLMRGVERQVEQRLKGKQP
jgi:prepilin-type N-terminal cleavage/methylation domain-containing protein